MGTQVPMDKGITMDTKKFKEIENRANSGSIPTTAYEAYGLRCDFKLEMTSDLSQLLHGYTAQQEKIAEDMAAFFLKPDFNKSPARSRKIAIIGPEGAGKTSLVDDMFSTLTSQRGTSKIANATQFAMSLSLHPFHGGRKRVLEMLDDFFPVDEGMKQGILSADDFQDGFYPVLGKSNEKKPLENFTLMQRFLDKFQSSFIITIWSVHGFFYANMQRPDFFKYFDKIIWLNGLEKRDMMQLLDKRLAYFSGQPNIKMESLFADKETYSLLVDNAQRNPRVAIYLISCVMEESHKKEFSGANSITREIAMNCLIEEGMDIANQMDAQEMLQDKIVFALLSQKKCSLRNLMAFTGHERTTLQRELLRLDKYIVKKSEDKQKEHFYYLKRLVKAKLENELMKQLCTKIDMSM